MADKDKQDGVVLETRLNKNGQETAATTLSSTGSVDEMYVSPNQAIPVILVPGIMGSPLISVKQKEEFWKKRGKWAWRPDNGGWMATGFGMLSASERKRLVNPEQTKAVEALHEVDDEALSDFIKDTTMPMEEAKRRGWGSVMISSYGGILNFLEVQLKFIFYHGHTYPGTEMARPHDEKLWGEIKGYQRLTDDELRKAAAWRFPVYAVGYNWIDTNTNAADKLKQRIDEIRKDCRERLNARCDKVILVTHSMGGLVARMCAKKYESDILGVVHGVQPAVGAGTAYARVRGGWESNALSQLPYPIATLKAMVGAWALGATGAEVTAVFANGAGPLELLPNHLYGSDWLRVEYEESGVFSSPTTIFSLPKSDPYKEIYEVSDRWWRLVHPGLLAQNEKERSDPEIMNAAWSGYIEKLGKAKTFHTTLGGYYHPNTYAHCGVDSGKKGWYKVTWKLTPMMDMATGIWARQPSVEVARDVAKLTSDGMIGTCMIHNPASAGQAMFMRDGKGSGGYYSGDCYRALLSSHDDPGDATVPGHSGMAPKVNVPFFAKMQGFEHQGSYDDDGARAVTLYSVLRLAAQAMPLA